MLDASEIVVMPHLEDVSRSSGCLLAIGHHAACLPRCRVPSVVVWMPIFAVGGAASPPPRWSSGPLLEAHGTRVSAPVQRCLDSLHWCCMRCVTGAAPACAGPGASHGGGGGRAGRS